ncbi:MAG: hypothetical protein AAB071_04130 [Bacteroidota bacterium]
MLRRGYAIVTRNNSVVTSTQQLHTNDDIRIQFHDGEADARIH